MGGGMRGPGRRMQGGTRIENPGKVFKRLMAYIFKNYAIHFIFVLICIVLSVVASIQGTLFMQRLIDDYILPMIGQKTRTLAICSGKLSVWLVFIWSVWRPLMLTTVSW